MRIALATPISIRSFGGAERKLVEAAEMLAKRQNDVSIYSLSISHPEFREKNAAAIPLLKDPNIEYCEAKSHKIEADVAYTVYVPFLWRRFKLSCPTVAGLHSPLLFASLNSTITFTNPLAAIQHYGSPLYMASFWLAASMKNLDLARFDAVRILNSSLKIKHKKVYCIPDWVNTDVFKPLVQKNGVFTILFPGRHHWEKGFDIFMGVAASLRKRGFDMKFVCTRRGKGPVEGAGFLDDEGLAKLYSSSHLVVYPARMDTFGGVIAEAAACGTPVITTRLPAHSLGLPLYYANSVDEFVKTAIRIYDLWNQHTDQYERISHLQREQALKFDVKNIFQHFESMLTQVARNATPNSR